MAEAPVPDEPVKRPGPPRAAPSGPPEELESVTVSRGGCEGTCPQEDFTFARSGVARFSGRSFSKRTGEFVSNVSVAQFEALAKALVGAGLYQLTDSCDEERQAVDAAVCFTLRYVRRGRTVERHLEQADAWELQRALDALADALAWRPAPKRGGPRQR